LLLLIVRLRKYTPVSARPRRLFWGIYVGSACSGILTIRYLIWILAAPIRFWSPVGLLALIGNVVNLICGVCVLLELTAEGVIAALLFGISQILWGVFGILVFTVDF
jgi:hypothetical protein